LQFQVALLQQLDQCRSGERTNAMLRGGRLMVTPIF
jgi:hypothetical protein